MCRDRQERRRHHPLPEQIPLSGITLLKSPCCVQHIRTSTSELRHQQRNRVRESQVVDGPVFTPQVSGCRKHVVCCVGKSAVKYEAKPTRCSVRKCIFRFPQNKVASTNSLLSSVINPHAGGAAANTCNNKCLRRYISNIVLMESLDSPSMSYNLKPPAKCLVAVFTRQLLYRLNPRCSLLQSSRPLSFLCDSQYVHFSFKGQFLQQSHFSPKGLKPFKKRQAVRQVENPSPDGTRDSPQTELQSTLTYNYAGVYAVHGGV